jgi:hypothetical protein
MRKVCLSQLIIIVKGDSVMSKRIAGIIVVLALISCLVFSSCDAEMVGAVGSNGPNHAQESYHYLNGTKTIDINTSVGQTIGVTYDSTVKSGSLSLQIMDPSKTAVSNLAAGTSGTTEINSSNGGVYQLVITGTKTQGSYDVSWSVK